ncbi:hypothetical protein BX661DRAFT_170284 [Kickxella alabastrina]|uniref:uncharacterized protein n=1 Tax=Kickxella alabastrina TaxID=61397 RepID=UPI002220882B|nr:uncharacterized protein BX661DRAFT_170284 [Kickxella alabastrina]KAI7829922.1 hypothetical protein BX661DRAFT_170284 [Kickxella alabastrina]KAJ1940933.1 hypothetical protein GGF37_003770 [Kickxella alabastrina]
MFKHSITILALVTLVAVNAQPLVPRGETYPSDIGIILNNVVGAFDLNESSTNPIVTQIGAAATKLMSAYGQDNQEEVDEKVMSSLLASLDAETDPKVASQLVARIAVFLDATEGFPTEIVDKYSSLALALQKPTVATEITAIVNELIGFVAGVRSAMVEKFGDTPNDTEVIENGESIETETETEVESKVELDEGELSEDSEETSDNHPTSFGSKSNSSESSSSSAASTSCIASGLLSVGVVAGMITALF